MNKKMMVLLAAGVLVGFGFAARPAHADMDVYRLYNRNSGRHYWTSSGYERQQLLNQGWKDEHVPWISASSGMPIYTLYDKKTGTHLYTTSVSTKNSKLKAGWTTQPSLGYSSGTVPVYQLYKKSSNDYFYTTSTAERDGQERAGYSYQGVAFDVKSTVPDGLIYASDVQGMGWQGWIDHAETSGTIGKSAALYYLKVEANNLGISGGVQYRVQVANKGWLGWTSNGANTGDGNRIEALQVELTGQLAQRYSIAYRAAGEYYSWQGWVTDGATAGTVGQSRRMEAFQIKLVPKIQYNKSDNKNFDTYSGVVGDVTYPQFEYLDANKNFQSIYQNNNQYAVYNNAVYNLNTKLLQDAQNADEADWKARQSWQVKLNQYNQAINADQTTLNAAQAQEKQYSTLVNQENTYLAQEKQNNLPMTQDETLLTEYTKDLATATQNVANAQATLNKDTSDLATFKQLGTDFVKLSATVSRDTTGRVVTVTETQTTQVAGKQTQKVWTYNQDLSD